MRISGYIGQVPKAVWVAWTRELCSTKAGHHNSSRSHVAVDGTRHTLILFAERTAEGQQGSVPQAKVQVSTCSSRAGQGHLSW